ncbi:MAG: alpha/beta hydrolase, partial [Pseudomonadota bacterium]|nr:alpha/beta hydrolase [Pseudomonadota bacterium]
IIFDNRDVGLSHKFSGELIQDPKLIWRYSYSKEKLPKEIKKPKIPYTLTDMAEDCANILNALDIEKAHILGTSMGGMIAQLMAYNFPEKSKSLISVMSTSGNPELPRASKEVIKALNRTPESDDKESVIKNALLTRKLWASPKYNIPEKNLIENFSLRYDRMYYPEGLSRQYAAIGADGSRVERLKKITIPSLVLHGDADNLVPLAGGKDTDRLIPNSNIKILDGWGHDLPSGVYEWLSSKISDHIFFLEG